MKTSFWRRWWQLVRGAKQGSPAARGRPRRQPLSLEALEDRNLLSGTPQLLADINPGAPGSYPSQMVVIDSTTYFIANDSTHGNELWKTDGTAAGTALVADINPGSAGSNPGNLTNVNGTLFFTANDGTHGNELWTSDGTAADTVMVADLNPGSAGSNPSFLTNVNGELFFSANDGTHGYELWKSDGTAAGTVLVADINPGSAGSYASNLTNVNGELFFSANDGTHGKELWKSDGTSAGTVMVADINPGVGSSNPSYLTNVNGKLFFSANDGTHGPVLWKSDGSAAGTTLVEDVAFDPAIFTNVNGELFFTAFDGTHGTELWKSDGTTAGTAMVKDINPGGNSSFLGHLTNVNGELFFSATDGTDGQQLWKSDGTVAGTTMVADINPGTITTYYYTGLYGNFTQSFATLSSYPSDLTNVNGTLYFAANDGTTGEELWKSDGTVAGTTLVQDINPGSFAQRRYITGYYGGVYETGIAYLPNSSNPGSLTNFNGTLLFAADDGVHGNELWARPPGPSLALSATVTTPTAGVADTFTITALNADGTPDTTLTGTVTLTSSDTRASYPTSVTLSNGTGQFNATFETAGSQSITATDVQTPSNSGSESDLVVQPAQASRFTLTGFPSPVTVGTAGSFTVTAYDIYGNVATGYSGSVHFSSSDPNALLPANATLTNGTGQFSATLETLGTGESITAADTRNSALTATESGIEVIPLVSISGPSAAAIGQTLTYTLGASGDPAGTRYTFAIQWGDGSAVQTLSGPSGTTVSHSYARSGLPSISVTATDPYYGLTSQPAYQSVNVLPVSVMIETDPANTSQQMLVVTGTANSDSIVLGSGASNGVTLTFDGTALGNILPTNGSPFALVEVFGEGGNDAIDARSLSVSSVLVGGAGNDTLYGGSGRNLLIGGLGADTLYAGSAGDILIGGPTSYDSNLTALASIMAEWHSPDSYTTRINKLLNGGGLNGSYVLNSTTVSDDNTTDVLYGGSGLDWFFAHLKGKNKDQVKGQTSGEVITGI